MLVPEPTFGGGKLIKMLTFDKTNSKSVEIFCRCFSIVELSLRVKVKLKLRLLTRLIGQVRT